MKERGISFNEEIETKVKFTNEKIKDSLEGILKFGKDHFPQLSIDSNHTKKQIELAFPKSTKFDIHCISGKKVYNLFGCCLNDTSSKIIYPECIVEGQIKNEFKSIEVLLSGVSAWFDQFNDFEVTDSEIKKDKPTRRFCEKVLINGSEHEIFSEYNWEIKRLEKKDTYISEYTTIIITRLSGNIDVFEAEYLAQDIRKIFSLLLNSPLSIEYAWLLETDKIRKPFFFHYTGELKEPFESTNECFINPNMIFNSNAWERIFYNYFNKNKKRFKKLWSRLPSLYSYNGFWEHRIMGYVTILEAYCDSHTEKKGNKLDKIDFAELKQQLFNAIDQYIEDKKLDDISYSRVVRSIKNGIELIRNTDLPTFKGKFNFLLSNIDQNIKDIIDFSSEEFKTIKDLRNKVAHGLPVLPKNNRDITYEMKITDKIRLLLTYLVYLDFGFSPLDFAKCLRRTFSRFVLNVEKNRMKLDRYIGDVPFYEMDEENYLLATQTRLPYLGIDYIKSKNLYKFSSETTDILVNFLHESSQGISQKIHILDYVKDKLPRTVGLSREYLSQAYLTCREKYSDTYHVILVTYS